MRGPPVVRHVAALALRLAAARRNTETGGGRLLGGRLGLKAAGLPMQNLASKSTPCSYGTYIHTLLGGVWGPEGRHSLFSRSRPDPPQLKLWRSFGAHTHTAQTDCPNRLPNVQRGAALRGTSFGGVLGAYSTSCGGAEECHPRAGADGGRVGDARRVTLR